MVAGTFKAFRLKRDCAVAWPFGGGELALLALIVALA